MIEYVILDIDQDWKENQSIGSGKKASKIALAQVTCVRVSDFGVNDIIFQTSTHLAHVIKPGDTVLGYDMSNAVIGDDYVKRLKRHPLLDVILVKKNFS